MALELAVAKLARIVLCQVSVDANFTAVAAQAQELTRVGKGSVRHKNEDGNFLELRGKLATHLH